MLRRALARRPAPAVEALDGGLEILRRADLRADVGAIACPTLVISGEHDRLTPPAAGEWLAAAMPDARHRLIRGAAHAPFLSHAHEVLDELRRFLAGPATPVAFEVRA
jgi:pimeloyl-[acyl-carrier protein] methyl ester esterase